MSDSVGDGCVLFQGMTATERQAVLEKMERHQFTAGEEILHEGGESHSLFVVTSGRCSVHKHANAGGPQRHLAFLDPGAVFGEMSFLNAATHSASVKAESAVELLRLKRELFEGLLAEHPALAAMVLKNVVGILSDRLRRMDDWVCNLIEGESCHPKTEEWRQFRARLFTEWNLA
jgi:CRP-like cAMP-binding protein